MAVIVLFVFIWGENRIVKTKKESQNNGCHAPLFCFNIFFHIFAFIDRVLILL